MRFAPLIAAVVCLAVGALAMAQDPPFRSAPQSAADLPSDSLEFDAPTALAFDSQNRPYLFNMREPESYGSMYTLRDSGWVALNYLDELLKVVPTLVEPPEHYHESLGSITIDDADHLYAVIPFWIETGGLRFAILYSEDYGQTFQVIPTLGRLVIELRVGQRKMPNPPLIGMVRFRQKYPNRWADNYDLVTFVPLKVNNKIALGVPILITSRCSGVANYAGGDSFGVTVGGAGYVAYAELPDSINGGNPIRVAVIDRASGDVLADEFVVNALPLEPDTRTTPVIAADGTNNLHLISGGRNSPFYYSRTYLDQDSTEAWFEPEPMGEDQTFASLVIDFENRLHCLYLSNSRLTYQSKDADSLLWGEPTVLADPPEGQLGTGNYYQRLFLDRKGALYISYSYHADEIEEESLEEVDRGPAEQTVYPRELFYSADGGESWLPVTTAIFQSRFADPDSVPTRD